MRGTVVGMLAAMAVSIAAVNAGKAQAQPDSPQLAWELGPTGSHASLRGVSAPTDQVIWSCGSQATVLRSLDGGSSWQEVGPESYGDLEFRSLHAWDAQRCCLASAGTPAVILLTHDGGATWSESFRHPDEAAFMDGLKFWDDQRGIVFGDPIDGRIVICESRDGGATWQEMPEDTVPKADGEAGFAASNSAMTIGLGGSVWIGTGVRAAPTSRIYQRSGFGKPWTVQECPLPSAATSGVFSIALGQSPGGDPLLVAVGGDYRQGMQTAEAERVDPPENSPTACWSGDGGRTWSAANRPPGEFRSAVLPIPTATLPSQGWICVGPTGSDWSPDGRHWWPLSSEGFHALAAGSHSVFAVGKRGRFARLVRTRHE